MDAHAVRTGNRHEPAEASGETLDPPDWASVAALAHRIVDDAIDHVQTVRERPVWRPMPENVEALFHAPLPDGPTPLEEVYGLVKFPAPMYQDQKRGWMLPIG